MTANYYFLQLSLFGVLICFPFSPIDGGSVNQTAAMRQQTILETKSHLNAAIDMIKLAQQKLSAVERMGNNNSAQCRCSVKPGDCQELLEQGYRRSGEYKIWPRSRLLADGIDVYCDMVTDGGGWTVFQRRMNSERARDYFFKNWNSYKNGFGDIMEDFWLGNNNIHALTNQKQCRLRINLTDWTNTTVHAEYDIFWLADEAHGYAMHVDGYSGNAGDSLLQHDGAKFSTSDRDNDQQSNRNYASSLKGAWWYTPNGYKSNLNGQYLQGGDDPQKVGVEWTAFRDKYSLWKTSMMLKPRDADELNDVQ